jgi:hypothetical protein
MWHFQRILLCEPWLITIKTEVWWNLRCKSYRITRIGIERKSQPCWWEYFFRMGHGKTWSVIRSFTWSPIIMCVSDCGYELPVQNLFFLLMIQVSLFYTHNWSVFKRAWVTFLLTETNGLKPTGCLWMYLSLKFFTFYKDIRRLFLGLAHVLTSMILHICLLLMVFVNSF